MYVPNTRDHFLELTSDDVRRNDNFFYKGKTDEIHLSFFFLQYSASAKHELAGRSNIHKRR